MPHFPARAARGPSSYPAARWRQAATALRATVSLSCARMAEAGEAAARAWRRRRRSPARDRPSPSAGRRPRRPARSAGCRECRRARRSSRRPAIAAPAARATSMTGASSSAIMRIACPAVPPSRRIVASSARRSPVDMAAVLISASAANTTDSPTISHTPHAPSLLEECRCEVLRPGQRPHARVGAAYRASERSAAGAAGDEHGIASPRAARVAPGHGEHRARRRRARPSARRPRRRAASRPACRPCAPCNSSRPSGGPRPRPRCSPPRPMPRTSPSLPRSTWRSRAGRCRAPLPPPPPTACPSRGPSSSRKTLVGSTRRQRRRRAGGRAGPRCRPAAARRRARPRRGRGDARRGHPFDVLLRARLQDGLRADEHRDQHDRGRQRCRAPAVGGQARAREQPGGTEEPQRAASMAAAGRPSSTRPSSAVPVASRMPADDREGQRRLAREHDRHRDPAAEADGTPASVWIQPGPRHVRSRPRAAPRLGAMRPARRAAATTASCAMHDAAAERRDERDPRVRRRERRPAYAVVGEDADDRDSRTAGPRARRARPPPATRSAPRRRSAGGPARGVAPRARSTAVSRRRWAMASANVPATTNSATAPAMPPIAPKMAIRPARSAAAGRRRRHRRRGRVEHVDAGPHRSAQPRAQHGRRRAGLGDHADGVDTLRARRTAPRRRRARRTRPPGSRSPAARPSARPLTR